MAMDWKYNEDITALRSQVMALRDDNGKMIADLAKHADADFSCEGCGAPLFAGDDYVASEDDSIYGCWATMTDLESKRERPCYAYRVGKCSALSAPSAAPAERE